MYWLKVAEMHSQISFDPSYLRIIYKFNACLKGNLTY